MRVAAVEGDWPMTRLLFALLLAILWIAPITPASAQADVLPAVSADGAIAPLTPDQLEPQERATYAALDPAGNEARQFLFTRGFLRYCRLVVAGTMRAEELPALPPRADWNRRFLSAHEATEIVDVALAMSIQTMLAPPVAAPPIDPAVAREANLPALSQDGSVEPLTPDQLNPAERAIFATLSPGGEDARRFLHTRGYLRYCQLLVDGRIDPRSLPALPARENWDRAFLSADEARDILDVALGMNLISMMKNPGE
jgi:hypothetical protein